MVCATSKGSDQPAHTRRLITAFASRLNILCVEHLFEFLCLTGGAQARLILHLSKCHIVGNHVSRLKCSCFLLLIQLDKKVITKIALGEEDGSASLIKHCCDKTKYYTNITEERVVNGTLTNVTEEVRTCKTYCKFIFLYLHFRSKPLMNLY